MRILILGNSRSGKTTMARQLSEAHGVAHLDLDAIAWGEAAVRLPLAESVVKLERFIASHGSWVIEGSYADLAREASAHCTEFRFLNPGVETCAAHCKARPWEPAKFASKAEQDERLAFLLDWVRTYPTRTDEYGLIQHRAVFDAFEGCKREYTEGDA